MPLGRGNSGGYLLPCSPDINWSISPNQIIMIEEYNINFVGYKIQSQDIKHVRVQKVLPEGAISGSISDKVFFV